MGFRFFKRLKILPGVTLNLSKSGPSVSVGPRGARLTMGPRGTRASVGLPGTGLSYTTRLGPSRKPKRGSSGRTRQAQLHEAEAPAQDYFDSLNASGEEKALVEGCRDLSAGDEAAALKHLRAAAGIADGAFLAGFLALRQDQLDEAAAHLTAALQREKELGQTLARFGLEPAIELPVTEEVSAHIQAGTEGVLLALAETYERLGRRPEAIAHLRRLNQLDPADVLVKLSLAELLLESEPVAEQARQEVVRLAEGVENDTPVHTALLLYKARALRGLGLLEAAQAGLAQALRRKKDRPAELLAALQYERGLAYEAAGDQARARSEFEKVYALSPDYEGVAGRLGL